MTSVDFFRAFAADTTTVASKKVAYYFEHSREDFANLYDADSPEDDQIKMFHYTHDIQVEQSESGSVTGVRYAGEITVVIKSDLDETIDVQKDTEKADAKYELRIKPMIEDGGIIAEIIEYNRCNTARDFEISFSGLKEVYNMFDFNADGITFLYELFISV